MPHVDEGMLHAYLDGALDALLEAGALPAGTTRDSIDAHLAVCADCRALLDAERTIRTRAGAVLDAAAPVVDVPPFNELFATARNRAPRRRVWPLAWAASVLLAVGAGWWGSELFRNQMLASRSAELTAPSVEADRSGFDDVSRDGGAAASQPVAAPATQMDLQRAESAGANLTDAAAPVGTVAGARDERQGGDATSGRSREGGIARPRQPQLAEAETVRVDVARRTAAVDTGRAGRTVLGAAVSAVTVEPTTAALQAERRRAEIAAEPPPSAPPPPVAQLRAPAEAFRVGGDPGVDAFRRTLAQLDAGLVPLSADRLPADLPVLQIDGGSAPNVQRGSVIGVDLARVTQRAPNGVEVEVIVWRQAALALNEIVVTGRVAAAADSAAGQRARQRAEPDRQQRERADAERTQQKAQAGAAAPTTHTVLASRVLADGRRELLLRPRNGNVLVALRAAVTEAVLQELAARLVEVPRD